MGTKKFDTKIQYLKYKVLREIARLAWDDKLLERMTDIPKIIVPGRDSSMRCCVYKERAIVNERMKMAMGGTRSNPNVIEILDIACDECPVSGFNVTESCRGCLAHNCDEVCPRDAITFDEKLKAHIDKSKCIECGACAKVCPYSAIANHKRPCENACKVKAIHMGENREAEIDNEKCISCGACVYQCPFGAITEKSFILNAIDYIKQSDNNKNFKVYAMIAPAIAGQFTYAKIEQVITAIKMLGFYNVVEAALGADMVAVEESKEFAQRDGLMTSSCCPAFVAYIEKNFPELKENISTGLSPMAELARHMKEKEPNCKIVFFGPCTAKKMEFQKPEIKKYVDTVLTFEELQALFDSKDIDLSSLEDDFVNDASYYGRSFAYSKGVTNAIEEAIKEQKFDSVEFNPIVCSGIEECKKALLRASKNMLQHNFIEGMACAGGCIGGAGGLTHHKENDNKLIVEFAEKADKTIIK